MSGDFENPYRPPDTSFEPASPVDGDDSRWLIRCIGLQTFTSVVGAGIAMLDIETIIASGPILSVLGLITARLAWRKERPLAMLLGLSGPGISLFCFVVINVNEWSPGDAQVPISAVAVVYALLATALGIMLMARQPDYR